MTETLALHGGPKTATEPFPAWPRLCDKAVAEATEVLRSGRLSAHAGGRVAAFEKAWAAWCGAPHAVAVASGTAALHAALLALGIGAGDEVIVPSHTFASTALAVAQAGATPVFCDVTADQTIDPRGIEQMATERARAVIVVHLYGIACDMQRILDVAAAYGLLLVEDCAQAAGAEWRGRKVGSIGDAGCFSFSQVKHLTTAGEGGMVVSGREAVAGAVRTLRDYGRGAANLHERVGWNYRMTEVQAAFGLAEMERLADWNIGRRRGFARAYDHAFGQLPGVLAVPLSTEERTASWWYYPLQLELPRLTADIGEVRAALEAEGVPLGPVPWVEGYQEPALAGRCVGGPCPVAEELRQRTLPLCLFPTWERDHVETVIAGVKKVLRAFKR